MTEQRTIPQDIALQTTKETVEPASDQETSLSPEQARGLAELLIAKADILATAAEAIGSQDLQTSDPTLYQEVAEACRNPLLIDWAYAVLDQDLDQASSDQLDATWRRRARIEAVFFTVAPHQLMASGI